MTILDEILDHTRTVVAAAKRDVSPAEMADRARAQAEPTRGFRAALASGAAPCIIAELKRRSPSKGEICADFDPVVIARAYQAGGAAALSVLTDEKYFGGSLSFLPAVRAASGLPLLRKDFVVDGYQIDEARAAGADAVLLIVGALADEELAALGAHARELGLDALVEIHDETELARALAAGSDLLGINNRDLRRFSTDLAVTERLAPEVPEDVLIVAESGIVAAEDVKRLAACGARAFLVGESLMRDPDPGAALAQLRNGV